MPDSVGITWASEVKDPKSDPQVTDQHGEADMSSEETSLKTPVPGDTAFQASGYFDSPSSYPTAQNHGTGTGPGTQIEGALSGRTSAQTSSGSLKNLSGETVRRALSQRSSHSQMRGRRASHSKSASSSLSRRSPNSEHPTYPDQSFASLQNQFVRPAPPLRTRSSNPAQNLLYTDIKKDRSPLNTGTWTADNTPMSSPSLSTLIDGLSPSESLHHLQTPKETHIADVDHDMYTGNKLINNYEVLTELGRGEHGKVKLGRTIGDQNQYHVAIKIVPRFSKIRRLGRLGAPQDKTKKEVAILKKARHPNVVSLLEVIDDPSKNKVYLILEFVDNGEIRWRKQGVREVAAVALRRFEHEKRGEPFNLAEKDKFGVDEAKKRRARHERGEHVAAHNTPSWSLEFADDEEDNLSEVSRIASHARDSENMSRASTNDDYDDPDLAGTMYGSYSDVQRDRRKFSIATSAISHMSSEFTFDHDEQDAYVPALTIEEARRAFRDTLLGLEFLHYLNIIHRDIKPANLLVTRDGGTKISDFGVSYLGRPTSDEEETKVSEKDAPDYEDERGLAKTVGTPAFWAPELCYEDPAIFEDGKPPKVTAAIDLWALGITLFCMIYARLPFNQTKDIGLHEAICNEKVFIPKSRLVPVDYTKDQPTAEIPHSINSNKRLDFELRFEDVPEQVRDLIKKLLIKDPAKRMTIAEAKNHPWVVEGVENQAAWLEAPTVKQAEVKASILDPDEKELSYAVVSRNVIRQTINTAKGIMGSLLGRKDSRKRASSSATSASQSNESVIASPAPSNASTVGKSVKEGRRQSLKTDELISALKISRDPEHPLAQSQTASPGTPDQASYFEDVPEKRPPGPDRAVSSMSAADSVRTVRASQRPPIPELHPDLEHISDSGLRSRVENLFEGAGKALNRLASRDRWNRSPSSSRASSEGGDAHGGPTIAVSTASASGNMLTPDALRTQSPVEYPVEERRHSRFSPPASSEAAFGQAQEINQRRFIQEAMASAEAAANVPERRKSSDSCPPSPDDITYLRKQKELDAGPSASTIASSVNDTGNSSSSQNMSIHSFDMPSNASSPPTEGFLSIDFKEPPAEPDFMRTADTVKARPTATGAPLEDQGPDDVDEYDSEEEGLVMGGSTKKK